MNAPDVAILGAILFAALGGWRLGLVAAMAGMLALSFAISFARDFFALTLPTWQGLGVTAGITVLTCLLMGLVGRRPPGMARPPDERGSGPTGTTEQPGRHDRADTVHLSSLLPCSATVCDI